MRTVSGKATSIVQQLVDRITLSSQMTRAEHVQLTSMLLSSAKLTHEERNQINRIFDQIQIGRLKLVD